MTWLYTVRVLSKLVPRSLEVWHFAPTVFLLLPILKRKTILLWDQWRFIKHNYFHDYHSILCYHVSRLFVCSVQCFSWSQQKKRANITGHHHKIQHLRCECSLCALIWCWCTDENKNLLLAKSYLVRQCKDTKSVRLDYLCDGWHRRH